MCVLNMYGLYCIYLCIIVCCYCSFFFCFVLFIQFCCFALFSCDSWSYNLHSIDFIDSIQNSSSDISFCMDIRCLFVSTCSIELSELYVCASLVFFLFLQITEHNKRFVLSFSLTLSLCSFLSSISSI